MHTPTSRPTRRSFVQFAALGLGSAAALAACGADDSEAGTAPSAGSTTSGGNSGATDTFPLTVTHKYGETVVESEPQRVVVVGLTEQDVLLELGVVPIATTEWYGEKPGATWEWAQDLLGGATPEVLDQSDGPQTERIAALTPDLIIGTNAGMTQEQYDTLSRIAPTVTSITGAEDYFSDWKDQTRQIAAAVGRSAGGEDLIAGVEEAYAAAAAEHPEFAGLQATFSQGSAYEGELWVYPDGVNTDFLTDLGFVMTPGLEQWAAVEGQQAQISAERIDLIDADVIVFATEEEGSIEELLSFGTIRTLGAVAENRAVYTDPILSGAIYFLTPLSMKYTLERLVPRLVKAVAGQSPQSMEG